MGGRSPFPPYDLAEALLIARAIWDHNAGKPMRRLTLFDTLRRSPTSGATRQLITASLAYGLTEGGHSAEVLALTERGRAIVDGHAVRAMLDAVLSIPLFKAFFDNYRNGAVPSESAAVDFLRGHGIRDKSARACLEVLLRDAEQVALIQQVSGVKRVVSPESALEKLQAGDRGPAAATAAQPERLQVTTTVTSEMKEATASLPATQEPQPPSLHIDIQIHIAADAKAEQIDQVFASMARHLYGRV